jgi:hypothetical protein
MSPILRERPKTLGAGTPQPFTLFQNFQPIATFPNTDDGKRSDEVWLYPGRPDHGPCEWGYRVGGGPWCASCDRRIMDPQPTHFAYMDNTRTP